MKEIIEIGKKAKKAAYELAHLDSDVKNWQDRSDEIQSNAPLPD